MARYSTLCAAPDCPDDAVADGRCANHRRRPWRNRSRSSVQLNGRQRKAHADERDRAVARSGGACECCGRVPRRGDPPLQLHHPTPISQGGRVVQPDARLLCTDCHLDADRQAGARR